MIKSYLSCFSVAVLAVLAVHPLVAMPSDYADQTTPLVSAEELNLLYGSIPHKPKFDIFTIHASHRKNYATKYYILSKPHTHTADKRVYMIAGTSPGGCSIYYEGEDIPFAGKSAPILERSMPMDALWDIYMASQVADFSLPEVDPEQSPDQDENATAGTPKIQKPTVGDETNTLIDQIVEGVGEKKEELPENVKQSQTVEPQTVDERKDVTLVSRVNLPLLPRGGYWSLVASHDSPSHVTESWCWLGDVSAASSALPDNAPDFVVDVDFRRQTPPPSAETIARGYARASQMYSYDDISYHPLDDGAEWVQFKSENSQGIKKIFEVEDGYVTLTLKYPSEITEMSENNQDQLEQMIQSVKETTLK